MKVRPTYRFLTNPSPYGMPDSCEYPAAAAVAESGTPMTMSASTGCSLASSLPISIRLAYMSLPSMTLSGPGEVDVLEDA